MVHQILEPAQCRVRLPCELRGNLKSPGIMMKWGSGIAAIDR